MEDSLVPESDEGAHTSGSPSARPALIITTIAIALVVIAFDQLSKWWALNTLTLHKTVPVLGNALQWLLKMNSGAAFSLLSDTTWLFTILSTVVSVVIVINLPKIQARVWAVVIGLVLGGALGNLIDRLVREPSFGVGHVVDFIYTPWMLPAIYNVADIAVVSGMVLFLLCMLLGVQANGRRVKKHD